MLDWNKSLDTALKEISGGQQIQQQSEAAEQQKNLFELNLEKALLDLEQARKQVKPPAIPGTNISLTGNNLVDQYLVKQYGDYVKLWEAMRTKLAAEHPTLTPEQLDALTRHTVGIPPTEINSLADLTKIVEVSPEKIQEAVGGINLENQRKRLQEIQNKVKLAQELAAVKNPYKEKELEFTKQRLDLLRRQAEAQEKSAEASQELAKRRLGLEEKRVGLEERRLDAEERAKKVAEELELDYHDLKKKLTQAQIDNIYDDILSRKRGSSRRSSSLYDEITNVFSTIADTIEAQIRRMLPSADKLTEDTKANYQFLVENEVARGKRLADSKKRMILARIKAFQESGDITEKEADKLRSYLDEIYNMTFEGY